MAGSVVSQGARATRQPTWSIALALLQDSLLVVLSAFFAYLHFRAVVTEGTFKSLPFAAEQSLLVFMFLSRRRSVSTSNRPLDWLVAAGGWMPLLFQPTGSDGAITGVGTGLQMLGLALTCVGFVYLGRSFGVVAANRGLKINGPYRFVRHPIYASHFLTASGFLVANLSPLNVGLFGLFTICQVLRIRAEERVLSETSDYTRYSAAVRWRLVPGLY